MTLDNHAVPMAIVVAVPIMVPAAIVISVFIPPAEFTVIASTPVSIITDVNAKSLSGCHGRDC